MRKLLVFIIIIAAVYLIAARFLLNQWPLEGGQTTVKLYYYNIEEDRKIADYLSCSAVLPVDRKIPKTETLIQDTLELLMKGKLTPEEKAAGFETEFPLQGVKLVKTELKNGVLTLTFDDPENRTGGGSCRVRLLWRQIKNTALQFPEVKEVIFEPEFLFQP